MAGVPEGLAGVGLILEAPRGEILTPHLTTAPAAATSQPLQPFLT